MFSTQSEPASAGPTRPWPADQVERWPIERLIPYGQVLTGSQPHLMIADPPYGVSYEPSWRRRRKLSGGKLVVVKGFGDHRIDWRQAYTLFSGDVAYVWHGALHGDVVAAG